MTNLIEQSNEIIEKIKVKIKLKLDELRVSLTIKPLVQKLMT